MPVPKGVMIAIDWENIRRGANMYSLHITPKQIREAIASVAEIFGPTLGAKAFGDWSMRPEEGKAFEENGITLYNAPRTMTGKDRSDPCILIEVYDWLREMEDCKTVVLGSGDSDFQILIQRAKLLDKRIVLCTFSRSVSKDMLAATALSPLEAELGIELAEHGNIPAQNVTEEERQEIQDQDRERFIKEMNLLEGRMQFVGHNMLCNQWMSEWSIAWTEYDCRRLVEQWLEEEILQRHDVRNPNNPTYATPAIRLNKQNEIVRQTLGLNKTSVHNTISPHQ